MMYGHEKSRSAIVAVKPTNNAERPAVEPSAVAPTAAERTELCGGCEVTRIPTATGSQQVRIVSKPDSCA
jgi:hypothetical protein